MNLMRTIVPVPPWRWVGTAEEARSVAEYLHSARVFGYDTEGTGLSCYQDVPLIASFATRDFRVAMPVSLLEPFRPVLADPSVTLVGTNVKFDAHMFAQIGYHLRARLIDTVVWSWYADENRLTHGLKDWGKEIGVPIRTFPVEVAGIIRRIHDAILNQDKEEATLLLVLISNWLMKRDRPEEAELIRSAARDPVASIYDPFGQSADAAPAEDGGALSGVQAGKLLLSVHDLIRAGTPLKPARALTHLRALGAAPRSTGVGAATADIMAAVYGLHGLNKVERAQWAAVAESADTCMRATRMLYQTLLQRARLDYADPCAALLESIAEYSSLDPWTSLRVWEHLQERVSAVRVHHPVRGPLPPDTTYRLASADAEYTAVLWNMERQGVAFNKGAVEPLLAPLRAELQEVDTRLADAVRSFGVDTGGAAVNFASTPQLVSLFYHQDAYGRWYDRFNAPATSFTEKGAPSVATEVLEDWAERGMVLAKDLVRRRDITKTISTYLEKLPLYLTDATHESPEGIVLPEFRIHCTMRQAGTKTGRLSAADPNLTNIPIHTEEGALIRGLFCAGTWGGLNPDLALPCVHDVPWPRHHPGQRTTLLVADYSQLELVVMAHVSRDPSMLEAIRNKLDLHCVTVERATHGRYTYAQVKAAKDAVEAGNPTPEQVHLCEERTKKKRTGFGIIYGIGPVKLGAQLGEEIVRELRTRRGEQYLHETCPAGEQHIADYFAAFPGVKRYIDDTQQFCREYGYVVTEAGRIRRLPDINSAQKGLRKRAERQATNATIQGTAADIVKAAMLAVARSRRLRDLGCVLLLQIHDELVFELPDIPEVVAEARVLVRECMETSFPLSVPTRVSMGVGPTWSSAKK